MYAPSAVYLSAFCLVGHVLCAARDSENGLPQPNEITVRTPPGYEDLPNSDPRVMDDQDLLSCNYNYGSFLKAGPDYPVIGVGESLWQGGKGCGQCVKMTYGEKSTYGVVADHCPPNTCEFDISMVIAEELGFGYNNPDSKKFKVEPVPCSSDVWESYPSNANDLKYVFAAGSKDTSLEIIILGASGPIESVSMKVNGKGKKYKGAFSYQKWRFNSETGFNTYLRKKDKLEFSVKVSGVSSPITDKVDISSIAVGGGGAFFKASNDGKITTDNDGNNQAIPEVFSWSDILEGSNE